MAAITSVADACARAAHEANRAYCLAIGDTSQPSWDDAPDWQRSSALAGVAGALAGNTPEQSHASWLAEKVANGWTYGAVKDPEAKTHPCMVPYAELPPAQRAKDALFLAVVRATAAALTGGAAAPTIAEESEGVRGVLLDAELRVRAMLDHVSAHTVPVNAIVETHDHAKLALRAIEDARMRLGKVIQHARDGVSVYDRRPIATAMPGPGESGS